MSRINNLSRAQLAYLLAAAAIIGLIYCLSGSKQTDRNETLSVRLADIDKDETPRQSKMPIVGGLSAIRDSDDEIAEVVAKIKPILEDKVNLKFESIEVINYKHQVVAGKNYFVKARVKPVESGVPSIVHLRIYWPIRGDLELTAYQLDKSEQEEIVYFQ